MNDVIAMFRETLETEAKLLGTPNTTTISRALELCESAYQLGVKGTDWDALRNQYAGMAMQELIIARVSEGCDGILYTRDGLDPLYTLYQDLKKLREE